MVQEVRSDPTKHFSISGYKRVTEGLYNILILFLLHKVHLLSLRVSTTLRKGP